jgi:hypothetical protein
VAGAAVGWASSNPLVATVSAQGLVRAVAPGVAQLTARSGASSAAAVVTVAARPQRSTVPEQVAAAPVPAAPAAGQTQPAPVPPAPAAVTPVAPAPVSAARDTEKAVEVAPPPLKPVDPRPDIERALDTYRRAIESRDLGQLRLAYPGLTPDQERAWRDFFGNVSQLSATLSLKDLQVSGDRAQATVTGTYEYRSRTRQTQHVEFAAGFERRPAGWRLVSVK